MITYQEYNTKSPLNGLAAKWAAQNSSLLPIDSRNISPPAARPADSSSAAEPVAASSVSPAQADAAQVATPAAEEPALPPQDPWTEKISLV
jgi:hypothetical protein